MKYIRKYYIKEMVFSNQSEEINFYKNKLINNKWKVGDIYEQGTQGIVYNIIGHPDKVIKFTKEDHLQFYNIDDKWNPGYDMSENSEIFAKVFDYDSGYYSYDDYINDQYVNPKIKHDFIVMEKLDDKKPKNELNILINYAKNNGIEFKTYNNGYAEGYENHDDYIFFKKVIKRNDNFIVVNIVKKWYEFYMKLENTEFKYCDVKSSNFGYNKNNEIKLFDF